MALFLIPTEGRYRFMLSGSVFILMVLKYKFPKDENYQTQEQLNIFWQSHCLISHDASRFQGLSINIETLNNGKMVSFSVKN